MIGLKVSLKDAEKWKKYIVEKDFIDKTHYYSKDKEHIYFPVLERFDIAKKDSSHASFVEMEFPQSTIKGSLKKNLSGKLSEQEMDFVKTAHDTIGTIAIMEIPEDLEKHQKIIAQTLLEVNPQIKTVLKKAAIHGGVYRTQKMTYLAGENTKETTYKENDVRLKLDVEKVYFSIRLGNERKRIMRLVKPGEEILVMFSGCGVYPIVISKNSQAKHITGIEINPDGHKYGLENLRLNKIKNVNLICGDVHQEIPRLLKENPTLKYDRIIMPLPKTADEFLGDALAVARKGTVIHFYDFLPESQFDEALKKIDEECKKKGLKHKIIGVFKCGQHAPYIYRICVDFEIV